MCSFANIEDKLDKIIENQYRFPFMKLQRFVDQSGVSAETIKKYFPEAVHRKGVLWVDVRKIEQSIIES